MSNDPLYDAVVAQAQGLMKLEAMVYQKLIGVINAQGQGLRAAEARIAHLEALLSGAMKRTQATQFVQAPQRQLRAPQPQQRPRLVEVNPMPEPELDDSADYDFDSDDEAEAG